MNAHISTKALLTRILSFLFYKSELNLPFLVAVLCSFMGLFITDQGAIASIEKHQPKELLLPESILEDDLERAIANEAAEMLQITSVSQLSDIQPTDWAFQALQSLIERYGCLIGYPDSTFRGNQTLTRYEFVSVLNACLNKLYQQLENQISSLPSEDIAIVTRLLHDFGRWSQKPGFCVNSEQLNQPFLRETGFFCQSPISNESTVQLTNLPQQIENLETRTAQLEANQFSPTVKLGGSVILALSDLSGDRADGNPNSRIDSNISLNHRTRFNLVSSFTGKDRLLVRLQASDRVPNFNGLSATNMTRLSFEVGNTNNALRLNLLEYRFPIGEKLNIHLYGNSGSHHYYANVFNPYFASFGGGKGSPSRFAERHPIYRIGNTTGAGIGAVYRINQALRLDLGYLAQNAELPNLKQGLFDGTHSALAQLSIKPVSNLELGLTYIRNYTSSGDLTHRTGSTFASIPFGIGIPLVSNSYGIQGLWRINQQLALSGWFGYIDARRSDGIKGQADMINYAVNLAFPNLLKSGAIGGLGFGMPPKVINNTIASRQDRATGLHFEAFYEYPLTNNIKVIPGIMYLTNPNHNNINGNIFVGVFRTVFNF